MNNLHLSILGGGAMGGALARGLLKKKFIEADQISISDPETAKLKELSDFGVNITRSNIEALTGSNLIVIAVKPWLVKEVITEIEPHLNSNETELCLIVAGIPAEEIMGMFTRNIPSKISIAIPNTAMAVQESMTFIVPVNGQPNCALKVFEQLGKVLIIEERLLPGATALASCGIAFAMRYVRAACEGGVELGFRASQAQEIVAQTLEGAVALLKQPESHPEVEIDKVTTPGGLTIKGLNAMEREGFTNAIIEGLKASCNL